MMTYSNPIPFETGARVLASDGEEIGVFEDVQAALTDDEPSLLVTRMRATGNQVLIPLGVVDSTASTADTVRLNVDAAAFSALQADHGPGTDEPIRIEVHEEVLTPVTRDVHLGDVVIHKRIEEQPVETTVDLQRDDVVVEHVAVNREVESAPEPRYEGDTLIIPLVEEVLVTEKRLVLREEIRITRRRQTEPTQVRDVLRREVVEIEERMPQGDESPPS